MWFKHCLPVQPGSSHIGLSLYYFSIYQVRWKWNYCLSLLREKTFVEVGCWVHSEVTFRGIYTLCISLMLHILGHKEHTCLSIPLNSDGSDTSEADNGGRVFTKGFVPLHCLSVFSLWKENFFRTVSFLLRAVVVQDIYEHQEMVCMRKHNANTH